MLGGSLSGDFLPIQLVYQGKTTKCFPSVAFPESWHITSTPNHWCNEETMKSYVDIVLISYVQGKKQALGLPVTHPVLVNFFDVFSGQVTDGLLKSLKKTTFYVIVPPNCTDWLQPLGING